jgi:hypothetical protein
VVEAFAATLEVDPTLLRGLRHALARWLEGAGVQDRDRDAMVLATHEATAHAMQRAEAGSTIDVTANRDAANQFVVDVQSEGAWATVTADAHGVHAQLTELMSSVSTRTSQTVRMHKDT